MLDARIPRRTFVRSGALALGALAFGPAFYRDALAAPAQPGPGPYGEISTTPDANGLRLPQGFTSRKIVATGEPLPAPTAGQTYTWHPSPDGMGTFPTPDGGYILVSNSETPAGASPGAARTGGASAIRFSADGRILNAYRILADTNGNCGGGMTPWGTWMSGEEVTRVGLIWECDVTGRNPAVSRPAMGAFSHEAVCVDPVEGRLYLTEDEQVGNAQGQGGAFYRFTPTTYPDCSAGLLEIATVAPTTGAVTWTRIPDPAGIPTPTRQQVPGSTVFRRAEGTWFDSGIVYFTTTADSTLWAYDTRTKVIEALYTAAGSGGDTAILQDVDNMTVSRSGDIYVAEDDGGSDPLDIVIITPQRVLSRFLKLTGAAHSGSELSGVVFDPSGTRMYFSSMRSDGQAISPNGTIFEVTGPFRLPAAATPPTTTTTAAPPADGVVVPPPATPPTTPRPVPAGPAIGIEVPPRIRLADAVRRGIPVAFTLDEAAVVRIRLRGRFTSAPTARNPRPKVASRSVGLARGPRTRGTSLLRVAITPLGRRQLGKRRRAVRIGVEITLLDARGGQTKVLRSTVLTP